MADVFPILKISTNEKLLLKFFHECVDDLIEKSAISYENYSSEIEWTKDDFEKAKKWTQNVFRDGVTNEKLNVDSKVLKPLQDCFDIRRNEVFQALAREGVLKLGHNLTENIDWRLKWVMGSSKLATIREPLLQVDLHCCKYDSTGDKFEKNTVNFEANLEQVDELIEKLTAVQNELQSV